MNFSSGVKIEDISDYIGVAQDCIIDKPDEKDGRLVLGGSGLVEIQAPRDGGHFNQIQTDKKEQTAKITLDDCLACSGCVTSAETVLIQQQSAAEFLAVMKSNTPGMVVIVTISPQSCVSLAHRFGMSQTQMLQKLTTYFKRFKQVKHVFDSTFALNLSLLEAQEEFVRKYKENKSLPVLASECPGWIWYAEKSVGEDILPYLSAVKSPQAVMGSLVKTYLAEKLDISPSSIYHATIMPCYDKKLEAARKEFSDKTSGVKDVDCVLASLEVEQLLAAEDISKLEDSPLDSLFPTSNESALFSPLDRGGSGGYLENVFRYAAKKLFNVEIEGDLEYKRGRNSDFQEVSLKVDGKKVLRFASAYGFRNIQKITRQIQKTKQCKYDYVEIMACPSGCLNGGGQVKLDSKDIKAQRALIGDLDKSFHERQTYGSYLQTSKFRAERTIIFSIRVITRISRDYTLSGYTVNPGARMREKYCIRRSMLSRSLKLPTEYNGDHHV
eukprot:752136_1